MEPDHNPPGGVNDSVAVLQKVRLSSSPQPALSEGACHVPFDPV